MNFQIKIRKKPASVLTDALFPRRCPVCGQIVTPSGSLICPACLPELSFVKSPTCYKCGKEVMNDRIEYCRDCSRRTRSFERGFALLNYTETAARSMAAVKYKNKREYLDFYGAAAAGHLGEQILRTGVSCLVPVPVHASRRRKRGFNQAEVLAEILGRHLGIPVRTDLLYRTRKTEPQKNLSPDERLRNLEQAFEAGKAAEEEKIRSVMIVDDIYTTGATAEACTRVLLRAGIQQVFFFALCIGQGQ